MRNVISLDKMKQALEQKDLDLAAAHRMAREKTELADRKLASVRKLEDQNAKMKSVVDKGKKEIVQLKDEQAALTKKRDELEAYLSDLAQKMLLKLEGIPLQSTEKLSCHVVVDSLTFHACRILSEF